MDETESILLEHIKKYPHMQSCDAVKLIYQSEFGGGHMITDEKLCIERLEKESAGVSGTARETENIGGGLCRMYLCEQKRLGISNRTLGRMFMHTADKRGDTEAFFDKLKTLSRLADNGRTPFSADELECYLAEYKEVGCPAVSHSDIYRDSYLPAYRLIDSRYVRLLPVISAVEKMLKETGHALLAIDGRCASGKTTAAELLSVCFDAPIIHADDFFLPPELRSTERYVEPGGNIHYERIAEEVIPNLISGEPFSYGIFDCSTLKVSKKRKVRAAAVRIFEGAYSLHPKLGDYADISVFLDIAPNEQLDRIRERNGAYAEEFRRRWIPLEEKYFNWFDIKSNCDFIIN